MSSSSVQLPPESSLQANQELRKKIGPFINEYDADYYCLSNFLTAITIGFRELAAYEQDADGTFYDKDTQVELESESKVIGGALALPVSLILSIAVYSLVKKNRAKKLNDWFRRFQTSSKAGSYVGAFIGDLLGFFLPVVLKSPIKTFLSAAFSMISGVLGIAFGEDGPELPENKSISSVDRVTRDGWSRYAKIGMILGFVIGGAICALVLIIFPIALPAALSVAGLIAMCSTAGAIAGFGASIGIVRWWNSGTHGELMAKIIKWWSNESHDQRLTLVVDKRAEDTILIALPKKQIDGLHIDELQIVRSANKIEEIVGKHGEVKKIKCKILWYRAAGPDGKTRTAIIKIGFAEHHDIKHDPDQDFDPMDKDNAKEILKIASKNGHIHPLNLADSKHRTKYVRTAMAFGMTLGALIGLAFPVVYAPLVVLGIVAILAIAAWKFGPVLSRWINPHDQFYNSYDYGTATGLTLGKTMGSVVGNDLISNVIQLISGIGGGLFDAVQGFLQRRKLEKKLAKNKLSNAKLDLTDPKRKTNAEIEHEVSYKFEKKRPLIAWSQRLMPFVTYGGITFGAIGFLIGGPVGSIVGIFIGGIIFGGISLIWGKDIYAKIIAATGRLGEKWRKWRNKKREEDVKSAINVEDTVVVAADVPQSVQNHVISDPQPEQAIVAPNKNVLDDDAENSEKEVISSPLKKLPQPNIPILPFAMDPRITRLNAIDTRNEYDWDPAGGGCSDDMFEPSSFPSAISASVDLPCEVSVPRLNNPCQIIPASEIKSSVVINLPVNIGLELHENKQEQAYIEELFEDFIISDKEHSYHTAIFGENGVSSWVDKIIEDEADDDYQPNLVITDVRTLLLAQHVIAGEVKQARKIYELRPSRLLELVPQVQTDCSGCSYANSSSLQLAYLVGDSALLKSMLYSLAKQPAEIQEKARQQISELEERKARKIDFGKDSIINVFDELVEQLTNGSFIHNAIDSATATLYDSFIILCEPQNQDCYEKSEMANLFAKAIDMYIEKMGTWNWYQLSFFYNNIVCRLRDMLPDFYESANNMAIVYGSMATDLTLKNIYVNEKEDISREWKEFKEFHNGNVESFEKIKTALSEVGNIIDSFKYVQPHEKQANDLDKLIMADYLKNLFQTSDYDENKSEQRVDNFNENLIMLAKSEKIKMMFKFFQPSLSSGDKKPLVAKSRYCDLMGIS